MNVETQSLNTALVVVAVTSVAVAFAIARWRRRAALLAEPTSLDPQTEIAFPLVERTDLSHDTLRMKFALPSERHVLGLPVGQHVYLIAETGGKRVMRAYTPTSLDIDHGFFELVVKIYRPGVHPKYPEGGKLTGCLDKLAVGDTVLVRGPSGKITYAANGMLHIMQGRMRESQYVRKEPQTLRCKKIYMIAGGTGITPMYQILRSASNDPKDKTEFYLLSANQTPDDILLYNELQALAKQNDNIKLWFTVDTAQPGWAYSEGYVTQAMLESFFPPPDSSTAALVCGPPVMIKQACLPGLGAMGVDDSHILEF